LLLIVLNRYCKNRLNFIKRKEAARICTYLINTNGFFYNFKQTFKIQNNMQISFHGAAGCVTGSKHIIHLKNGKKILLDCGMFQGMGKETYDLNADFGFDPSAISVMVLSHAHIDHSGLIPRLIKQGFAGKIYCTPATKELTALLLEDSAQIQEMDVKAANKRRTLSKLPLFEPLYTKTDAINAMAQFVTYDYNKTFTILDSVTCTFTDTGHIIGSAAVHLKITENNITKQVSFSGDLGRYRDVILKSPQNFEQANYIIMESTYGNSLHDHSVDTPDLLLNWIEKTCLQKKGKLIIPAFSVGRTQEILYALSNLENEGRLPKLEYFVDSPLSEEATDVIKNYPQYYNSSISQVITNGDKDPFGFAGLRFVQSADESKLLNYKREACVIISASGMADAGRIKHHISNNIENSRNTILLSGYCEPNSLGGRLKRRPEEVMIFGLPHQVNAEIGELRSMSAHGDYEDMCQWLACQNPQQVERLFLVHGEPEVQLDFKQRLIKKGFVDVELPEMHEQFGLG
jgi:metallo-beta-lactamase family protein